MARSADEAILTESIVEEARRSKAPSQPAECRRRYWDRRLAGFSLLEVLVAMVILTVGATSLIALYAAAAATHKRSVDRTKASMVAEEILSEVRARYTPGVDLDELYSSLEAGLEEVIDGYRWSVVMVRPADGAESSRGTKRSKTAAATKTTAKTTKSSTTARKEAKDRKKDPTPAEKPEWTEEELLVRVTVRWSQSGREAGQTYQTLILPRPAPLAPWVSKKN